MTGIVVYSISSVLEILKDLSDPNLVQLKLSQMASFSSTAIVFAISLGVSIVLLVRS